MSKPQQKVKGNSRDGGETHAGKIKRIEYSSDEDDAEKAAGGPETCKASKTPLSKSRQKRRLVIDSDEEEEQNDNMEAADKETVEAVRNGGTAENGLSHDGGKSKVHTPPTSPIITSGIAAAKGVANPTPPKRRTGK